MTHHCEELVTIRNDTSNNGEPLRHEKRTSPRTQYCMLNFLLLLLRD